MRIYNANALIASGDDLEVLIISEVTMENWRSNYDELTEYIKSHPSIEISPSVMIIMDDVRPEFYRLFDKVRAQFVKEKYPALLIEAYKLSRNFNTASEKTMSCLNLKEIDVNPHLKAFILDPIDGLMRKLFEPLFALLQGKGTVDDFERISGELVENSARDYFHHAYTHWVVLSIMNLFKPTNAQIVSIADQTTEPDLTSADTRPGWYTEEIPKLVAIDRLALDFSLHTPFLVPRVVFHSDALDAFTAISTDFHEVYRKAKDVRKYLEWYSTEDIHREFGLGDLWPDIAIISGSTAEELRITADYYDVARPDILVDIMETENWYETGGLEKVKRHKNILKPRLGAFVICLHPVPDSAIDNLEHPKQTVFVATHDTPEGTQTTPAATTKQVLIETDPYHDIHLLNVGFDAEALSPVVEAMRKARNGDN